MKLQNLIHIVIGIVCVGLLPTMRAVSPAQDGGYPNGNTAEGQNALHSLTSGGYNTAIGFLSLFSDPQGSFNTAIGAGTLLANTGGNNTATGAAALLNNTTGAENTGNGAYALANNTTGASNTATGNDALYANTTGAHNVANGDAALFVNTTGNNNTAIGYEALFSNRGDENTANGHQALFNNTTGSQNTANGAYALYSNTGGPVNVANGNQALYHNTTGLANVADGYQALFYNTFGTDNTAIGALALYNTTGDFNVAIGAGAGLNNTNGGGNIYIGYNMVGDAADNDACYIGSIYGQTSPIGIPVLINANGKLGTTTSSKRFKDDIKPMDKASEALFELKPVTFHYKKELDSAGIQQFGLVAEEVQKVNSALIVLDKEGKPYSVRYDAVNAMLLNEFLKEHRKNEEQEATIAQLKQDFQSRLADQQKQIEALTTGLQKVSAQLETSKPARQVVNNP